MGWGLLKRIIFSPYFNGSLIYKLYLEPTDAVPSLVDHVSYRHLHYAILTKMDILIWIIGGPSYLDPPPVEKEVVDTLII